MIRMSSLQIHYSIQQRLKQNPGLNPLREAHQPTSLFGFGPLMAIDGKGIGNCPLYPSGGGG